MDGPGGSRKYIGLVGGYLIRASADSSRLLCTKALFSPGPFLSLLYFSSFLLPLCFFCSFSSPQLFVLLVLHSSVSFSFFLSPLSLPSAAYSS